MSTTPTSEKTTSSSALVPTDSDANPQPNWIEVPDELRQLLLSFSLTYLLEKPDDVVDFAVEYFRRMQKNQKCKSKPSIHEDYEDYGQPRGSSESIKQIERLSVRRKSVFSETYDPEADPDLDGEVNAIVVPKSDEQRKRLSGAVKEVLLFRSLETEQISCVLDAMFERPVTPNDVIVQQGDDGDNFYIIESGVYWVLVNDEHVETYDNFGTFGELALLYNVPRAATVVARTEGLLWAMDRQTFRRIVLKSAFKKRQMYESLLNNVPLLKLLQNYERMNLADALVSIEYADGAKIIKQGEPADGMYFIERGICAVRLDKDGTGVEVELRKMGTGEHFGELALLAHGIRNASVYAEQNVRVAFLDTECFERILGPYTEVIERHIHEYYVDENLREYLENLKLLRQSYI